MFVRTVFWAKRVHFWRSRPISVRLRCYDCRLVPVPRLHLFISIRSSTVSCLVLITTSYQLLHGHSYVFRRGVRTTVLFLAVFHLSVAFYVCTWITVTLASTYLTLYFTNGSPVTHPHWSYTDRHQLAGDVTTQNVELHRMTRDSRRRYYRIHSHGSADYIVCNRRQIEVSPVITSRIGGH